MAVVRSELAGLCRVCCAPCPEGESLPLFRVGLHRKVMACASVQVWQNDGLPDRICKGCAAKLHVSHQFKRLCEKSDLRLRQMRDTVKTITIDNNMLLDDEDLDLDDELLEVEFPRCKLRSPDLESIRKMIAAHADPDGSESLGDVSPIPLPEGFIDCISLDNSIDSTDVASMVANDAGMMATEFLPIANVSTEKEPSNAVDTDSSRCPVCNKAFSSQSKLNRHSRTHSDEILYRCDICNKGFVHGGNYKVHLRTHSDERPFSCDICDKRCRQRQDLEKHMRVHTGERPHVCSVCTRAFTTSSNLIAHERIHRGEKPYICPVCRKAFCQSNELSKHVRTHTGEKSHICSVCDKGFNGASTLNVHMRIHTGEKPYVCPICNKGFTQSSCLAAHSRKHSDTHKQLCSLCPRSFRTAEELQQHISAHQGVGYTCSVSGCNKSFIRPDDLMRHTKISHGEQA